MSWPETCSNHLVITKFLGTTRDTSNIFKTYKCIALQLHYLINLTKNKNDEQNYLLYLEKMSELESLTEYIIFNLNELNRLAPSKKIVILIDSLDQLNSNDFKNVDEWILTNIPSNTKYIVSTTPDHGNLLSVITKIILQNQNERMALPNMGTEVNQLLQLHLLHVEQLTVN